MSVIYEAGTEKQLGFQIHDFTDQRIPLPKLVEFGISIQNVRGDIYVFAPPGGHVVARETPGGMYGAVGTVYDSAGEILADYTFAPGGPTGGLFARLEARRE